MILARISQDLAFGQLQWKEAKDMEEKVTGIMGTQHRSAAPSHVSASRKGASALRRQM